MRGPRGDDAAGHAGVGNVDDERVDRGASLESENAADGVGVERQGAEAVDGFRGERDEFAGAEMPGRDRDGIGGRG